MKTRSPKEETIPRWIDRPPGGPDPEDRLAALMRQAEPNRGLDPAARARVLGRLTAPSFWRAPSRPVLRWVLVALVLFSSGVVVAAAGFARWGLPWKTADQAPPPARPPAVKTPRAERPVEGPAAPLPEPAVVALPAPAVVTAPAPVAAAAAVPQRPRLKRTKAHLRLAATAPAAAAARSAGALPVAEQPANDVAPPSPTLAPEPPAPAPAGQRAIEPEPANGTLSTEARLIKRALVQLRRDKDAIGALDQLNAYVARFPRGSLRHEADVARVDALLSLERESEALIVLDRLSFAPQGRDQELQLIRGELRSPHRCASAINDFTQVLSAAPAGPLLERALFGRAACRKRQGDTTGAARDLSAYLDRFPRGRFAVQARAALAAAER